MVKNAAKDVLIKLDQQELTSTAVVATATPPSETTGKKRKRTTEAELRAAMLEKMTGVKPPVEWDTLEQQVVEEQMNDQQANDHL